MGSISTISVYEPPLPYNAKEAFQTEIKKGAQVGIWDKICLKTHTLLEKKWEDTYEQIELIMEWYINPYQILSRIFKNYKEKSTLNKKEQTFCKYIFYMYPSATISLLVKELWENNSKQLLDSYPILKDNLQSQIKEMKNRWDKAKNDYHLLFPILQAKKSKKSEATVDKIIQWVWEKIQNVIKNHTEKEANISQKLLSTWELLPKLKYTQFEEEIEILWKTDKRKLKSRIKKAHYQTMSDFIIDYFSRRTEDKKITHCIWYIADLVLDPKVKEYYIHKQYKTLLKKEYKNPNDIISSIIKRYGIEQMVKYFYYETKKWDRHSKETWLLSREWHYFINSLQEELKDHTHYLYWLHKQIYKELEENNFEQEAIDYKQNHHF